MYCVQQRNGGSCSRPTLQGSGDLLLLPFPALVAGLKHGVSKLSRGKLLSLFFFYWYWARSLEVVSRLVILKHLKENLEPRVIFQLGIAVYFSWEFCFVSSGCLQYPCAFYCLWKNSLRHSSEIPVAFLRRKQQKSLHSEQLVGNLLPTGCQASSIWTCVRLRGCRLCRPLAYKHGRP